MPRSRAGMPVKGRGERPRDIVRSLNDLLAMERVVADVASGLTRMATTPAMVRFLDKLHDDAAWSCAGLGRVIRHLGGEVSPASPGAAWQVHALPTLRERLGRLNQDQAEVVRRLGRLLKAAPDRETLSFLSQMRSLHLENLHRSEPLVSAVAEAADVGAGSGS